MTGSRATAERCSTCCSDSDIASKVTSWEIYDSIYTERYLSRLEDNRAGYHDGGVNNISSFSNVDFLLAHGSGDDKYVFSCSPNAFRLIIFSIAFTWPIACTFSNSSQLTRFGSINLGYSQIRAIPSREEEHIGSFMGL